MIEKELIAEKVQLISRDLTRLEIFQHQTFDEAAKDFMKYAALKNILMEIIGRAIDINRHLIAERMSLVANAPKSYQETFLCLSEIKALPPVFAERIAQSAGFRNAIVHEYNHLDEGTVYKTVGEAIAQYAEYCQHIIDFLKTVP